jgi:site-specific DNA-cytosine methylase
MDFASETFVAGEVADPICANEQRTTSHAGNNPRPRNVVAVPTCFTAKDYGADAGELAPTLRAGGHTGSHANGGVMPAVAINLAVRRLTPRECERLQGFPDLYTDIPWRGKPAPDGPRYKALGNSWAVPCPAWIGRRIAIAETL